MIKLKIDKFYSYKEFVFKYKGTIDGNLLFESFIRNLGGDWESGGEVMRPREFAYLVTSVPTPA